MGNALATRERLRFEHISDSSGLVVIDECNRGSMCILVIETDAYGTQTYIVSKSANAGASDNSLVRLGAVGRVRGRVTGPVDCSVSNLRVAVQVNSDGGGYEGFATTTTNQKGEFEVPAVLAGHAQISLDLPDDFPFDHPPYTFDIKQDDVTPFDLKLARLKWLVGQCRDRETKQPVGGVGVHIVGPGVDRNIKSHQSGRFRFKLIPGRYELRIASPRGFVAPESSFSYVEIDEAFDDGATLPESTFELDRGTDVTGVVLDANDKPVPEAAISAIWPPSNNPLTYLRDRQAISDANGQFTLVDVWRGGPVRITAQTDDAATLQPTFYLVDSRVPLKLRVLPEASIRVSGQVVDSEKQGIAGANVSVWRRFKNGDDRIIWSHVVKGCFGIRTDHQGCFVAPIELSRSEPYEIVVAAQGFVCSESTTVDMSGADGRDLHVPTIRLMRDASQ